eukprot:315844-Amphidinium_carterae.1
MHKLSKVTALIVIGRGLVIIAFTLMFWYFTLIRRQWFSWGSAHESTVAALHACVCVCVCVCVCSWTCVTACGQPAGAWKGECDVQTPHWTMGSKAREGIN